MDIFPQSFISLGMQGRNISKEYRELELLTEVKLTPECRTRVSEEGEVLGIYESFRGVKEAISRNDVDMALFFLARLNPVAKERLVYELGSNKIHTEKYHTLALRSVLQELDLPSRVPVLEVEVEEIASGRKPFLNKDFAYRKTASELYYLVSAGREEALEQALFLFAKTTKANRPTDASFLFSACLKSGREDFVDRVVERLQSYLPYPRVEEMVAEIDDNYKKVEDYVLQQLNLSIELRYYSDALEGGNPRLFVYIFALSGRRPLYDEYALLQGYLTRRDLLSRYICAQFFAPHHYTLSSTAIDLHRILSEKLPLEERKDYALKFLSTNLGNVDILFYILDIYPEEKDYVCQLIKDNYQGLYPLSERILECF
ncbi:Hypothetical protein BRZCDTV_377 [Brazilian cedratvirus IHUMI]|uniref:Uncharacterized protein n=1 Tax=Brazilian cedratvirus IHUMI TaxID=2126980 RepID=A0A2R8FEY4_9VIRU|nr:Hypothetical protein BRZCDTV_377 [Brazilian cedratvirus IHUMI]